MWRPRVYGFISGVVLLVGLVLLLQPDEIRSVTQIPTTIDEIPLEVLQQLGLQEAPGTCLHEVVIYPGGDSIGVVWTQSPCVEWLDVNETTHWGLMIKSIAKLPYGCGIVFRLPNVSAPVIDTFPSWGVCGESVPGPVTPLTREATSVGVLHGVI